MQVNISYMDIHGLYGIHKDSESLRIHLDGFVDGCLFLSVTKMLVAVEENLESGAKASESNAPFSLRQAIYKAS